MSSWLRKVPRAHKFRKYRFAGLSFTCSQQFITSKRDWDFFDMIMKQMLENEILFAIWNRLSIDNER